MTAIYYLLYKRFEEQEGGLEALRKTIKEQKRTKGQEKLKID